MMKTLVVTIQGVQAIYTLIGGYTGAPSQTFNYYVAVDTIFFRWPLSACCAWRLVRG